MSERALVLGGGGASGNAWAIGVITGLFDAGLDVTQADLIIGTSAGSTVAAQITSTTRPTELLAAILAAVPQPRTGPAGSDAGRVPIGPAANHMELESIRWNKQPPAPALPEEVAARTGEKYRQAYRVLTGREQIGRAARRERG